MGIGMLLDMAAEAFGERVALGPRRNGLSYAGLSRAAAGGAGLIRAAGGRSVAFIGMSSQAFPALLFAGGRAGVSFTPVNYRLSPDQIHGLLAQLPDPVVVADEAYANVVRQAHVGVRLSREWLADAAAAAPAPAVERDDEPAVVLFTSGTTSAPKGVVLTHANDDGWFPTRDRGWFDTEGYLFIEGRSDDTIIRGGENIAPAEIEDVLFQHPAVREVAVLGIPDDEWGERICAAIVCAPLPSADTPLGAGEVRAWVRARLRGSRTPDDVVFVDEIPHTATGKVLRGQLRTQLSEGAGASARAGGEADARPAGR